MMTQFQTRKLYKGAGKKRFETAQLLLLFFKKNGC